MNAGARALLRASSMALGQLPVGSGQHRFVRILFDRVIAGEATSGTARLRDSDAEFELNLGDFVQAQAFLTRRYDPALVSFLLSRVHAGSIVADVGAHIGLVTVQLAKRCPMATVHAFEPFPDNVDALRRNVVRNQLDNVIINPLAVSEQAAVLRLAIAEEGSNWHHLDERAQSGVEVRSVTLDQYASDTGLERIDVLKLDVEGHEPSVLRGAGALLADGAIGVIVAEIHDEFRHRDGDGELSERLRSFGYKMSQIPELGLHRIRPPKRIYRNVFFERDAIT